MHRSSALFLGLFAVSAALQGAAACSSNPTTTPGADSGTPPPGNTEDSGGDTGPGISPPESCTGPLPVMTVTGPDGGQIEPDWTCYGDAGFLFHPFDLDGGDAGDASDDGGDAGADASVDAADAAPTPDAAPPVDSSAPDSSTDSGSGGPLTYKLHLTDFVSSAPPVGASVDIFWGASSTVAPAYSGVIDSLGDMLFPTPPAGQPLLSYHVSNARGDAGQASEYWVAAIIQAPPNPTSFNSLSVSSETELVKSVLGSETPDPTLSLIVSGGCDCQYRDVHGGQFQMVEAATGTPVPLGTTTGSTRITYLRNNLPDTTCKYTTNQNGRSVWAMLDGPADTNKKYTLQFMGRMTSSQATPVVFAEYPVESYPGAVSVLRGFRLHPDAKPPSY